jgi:type I restriction enzyme M protein
MLDTATKKRIDDCRDILVGKLPDPKAQIEQITIGLIYKFMDDMDKETIELGGKAKFFSDYSIPDPDNPKKKKLVPFTQYRWDNLFSPKVTATEMLRLYQEAIEGMDKNPNIPQLFRDIFKNAYLPYRDPETLKLFLKTISEFEYTHSEKLGDAFEYLLSVMGSQGDAGQFRTPRHIIDFVVAAVNPGKTDTILDPACGTAGFLISAFKHIKEQNKKGLTPDERKKLIQNFVGYDISPDMVRLSLVNLYLHGFNDPHIWEYDTLSSEERWDETFDVILANPPFMSPKGGIRPHKKFTISSNRSEVLFVDYIAEHLSRKGRAGIIVPEGVIFQSGTAYKDLRKMLVDNYLYAVVSLPAGVFNPYSGVKTSILLMDADFAKKSKKILFVKIDNDGYGLGAQRNAIKGGQLEQAIELLEQFKESNFSDSKVAHAVTKKEIAKKGDYNLSGERYKISEKAYDNSSYQRLGNVCDFKRGPFGGSLKKEIFVEKGYPIYEQSHAIYNQFQDFRYFITKEKFLEMKGFEVCPNDLIMSCSGTMGKVSIVPDNAPIGIINQALLKLSPSKNIIPVYLRLLMESEPFQEALSKTVMGVAIQNVASVKVLKELEIPLPPISIQKEIVTEIEGYQKIIDGAKAVVENYVPQIDIDSDWEMMQLESISTKLGDGLHGTPEYSSEGDYYFINGNNLLDSKISFKESTKRVSKKEYDKYKKELTNRTILVSINGTLGNVAIYNNEKVVLGKSVCYINLKENIDKEFVKIYLQSTNFLDYTLRMSTGSTIQNVSLQSMRSFNIPIPPIETQKQIVTQIEKEQTLVNANKQLIKIFEQKIKDRIAKVWGADKKKPVVYEENYLVTVAAEE